MTSRIAGAGLAVVALLFTVLWLQSLRRRDVSIVDIWWGPGFALLAWLYGWLAGTSHARPLVAATLVTVWAARLAWHIHTRHRGGGEDPRYGAMRARHGDAFPLWSLFIVFWLQAALLWFIAWPLLALAIAPGPATVGALDVVGVAFFLLGLTFETVGDAQLRRFRADPANRGRVLDTGLWHYTRHPNYFGDALLWWGLYLVAASSPIGRFTLASPALMTFLLLRVSGVTLLEQSLRTTRSGYADYVATTPAFVPWFPRRTEGCGVTLSSPARRRARRAAPRLSGHR